MPPFVYENTVPSVDGVFLLPVPFVAWFNDSIISALAQMTTRENWRGQPFDEDQLQNAMSYASRAIAEAKILNFNPFPPGMVFPFGGTIAPAGYLACDGASYAVDDYPELFAQIAYYFGGSGANFNVPNLINRVAVGSTGDFAIGNTGGSQAVTLDVSQIPSHSHSDIGHTHSIPLITGFPTQEGIGVNRNLTVPILTDSTGIGFANIQNTGGGGSHDNMQPFQALLYIIYAGRDNA